MREELEEKHDDSDVLRGFSRQEGAALVDLAHLVLLIDAELTDRELEQLERRVLGLTLDEGSVLEDVLADTDIVRPAELREILQDREAIESFVDGRTAVFESDDHKREALRVFATLSYSDGLEEEEEGICHDIGRAFGFDDETIDDLLVDGAVDVWELGGDRVE